MKKAGASGRSQSSHFLTVPDVWGKDVMLQQSHEEFQFYFQSVILLPHILAPEMCYTEDVVKILDQIVNNNLRQISTYNFKKITLDLIKCLRVFEGCENCFKVNV